MAMPDLLVVNDAPAEISCDALVLGAASGTDGPELAGAAGEIDRALEGGIATFLRNSGFKAKAGEVALVPTLGRLPAASLCLIGLGRGVDDSGAARRSAGSAARRLAHFTDIACAFEESQAAAVLEGLLLGAYSFDRYKTDPRPSKIERVRFLGASERTVQRAKTVAEAVRLARDLTNEPAQALFPEALSERVGELADAAGLEFVSWDHGELAQRGFGGLLGVSAGSTRPPRLLQLRYSPERATDGKVALVGKGVTFDSGGLSLKTMPQMEQMKTDKAGAAAVIGCMTAVARLAPELDVVAVIPATENMPGPEAVKPGDVLTHYGGRTCEVLNTDAEGRLILADALAFASELEPSAIVDVATLTGTIHVALGSKVSGLFANDDALATELEQAAAVTGERVWRMPLVDEYRKDLDTPMADIKNMATRYGGAIYAALFLRDFVGKGIPWAHLDIAGTGRAENDSNEITKGGTGVATRMLIHWIEQRAKNGGPR